jgi:homoserine kinase type II
MSEPIVSIPGFEELLARYPRAVQPLDPLQALGGAGGLSGGRLWRYRSEAGLLVLRAWPPDGPGRAQLERVHHWLSRALDLGFLPAPIADRAGRTLQEHAGRFWELAPWLPGAAEPSGPPPSSRLRAAFAAMAAFHQRLAGERREGVSPGLGQRYEAVQRLVQGGLETLEQAIGRGGGRDPAGCRSAATRWLGLARLVAPRLRDPLRLAAGRTVPLQPCLRDARPDHFLFESDRVSGLVDFGAMDVDCVAGDLARLIGDWLDGDPAARAEALAAYEAVRPLAPAESALIAVFEAAADLLIGEHWIRWHYVEGRRFDDPRAIAQGIARGLDRLSSLFLGSLRGLPR